MDDEAEWLAKAAEDFAPSPGARAPGELRRYLQANFEAVMALKSDRKLSWGQVAAILSKRGLTKANGSPLDANIVAVTAAAVRLERPGARRKRRPVKPQVTQVVSAAPAPEPTKAEVPAPAPPPPAAPESAEAPAMPAADPELARVLGSIRELPTVPPPNFRAGWRKKES